MIHHFVEHALAERAFAEEADRDLAGAQALGRKRRAGGDAGAAADDGVGAQVAGVGIGDVHGAAFTLAIAGFFAKQLGEHAVDRRAFREAMAVAAMRAGDVVVGTERLADADGDGFLTYIEVSEAGHQGAGVEIVDLFFEQPDHQHPAVHAEQAFGAGGGVSRGRVYSGGHWGSFDIIIHFTWEWSPLSTCLS